MIQYACNLYIVQIININGGITMETISFIINLLTAITLLIFLIVLTLDRLKQHNIKFAYARLAFNLTLITFSIAELVIHIIT